MVGRWEADKRGSLEPRLSAPVSKTIPAKALPTFCHPEACLDIWRKSRLGMVHMPSIPVLKGPGGGGGRRVCVNSRLAGLQSELQASKGTL